MKFKYLGSGASEGIPAIFCKCSVCEMSRKKGGRYIRTRSQAMINDDLLIDFPCDTYMHVLNYNIDMSKVKSCIVTHNHSDHFYSSDLECIFKPYAELKEEIKLNVYGGTAAGREMSKILFEEKMNGQKRLDFKLVAEFEKFTADKYIITPLPAWHDNLTSPLMYIIEEDSRRILYAHDTNYFRDEVWSYFEREKPYFNLVSLDCTQANDEVMSYIGHMNLNDNIRVRERLIKIGCADENTMFICNHFSHNGKNVLYDEFCSIAKMYGFETAYDGMEIEI